MALKFLNDGFFDGKVGIGTNSPDAGLAVKGLLSLALSGTITISNSSNAVTGTNTAFLTELKIKDAIKIGAEIFTISAIGSNTSLTLDSNVSIASTNVTAFKDPTLLSVRNGDNVVQAVVNKSGNVGIGTSSPTDLLALHNNATGAVDAQMNFTTAATGQLDGNGFRVGWNGNVAQMYLFENADMRIGTNNVERIRILADGNVGIGTTNPRAKLATSFNGGHTTGNIGIQDSSLDLYNPVQANTDEKGSILTFSDNYFNNGNYTPTTRAAIKGGTDTVGNTGDGFLSFYTDSGAANTMPERMRINYAGDVGIGTNNPLTLLNLEGVKNTSIITLESTTNDANWSVGDKIGAINFYSADDSGAGEGVKASMSYEVSSGGTSATNALVFNTAGTTTGTNNTERMRIDSVGNVGIGTDDPNERLEVAGNSITRSKTRGLGTNYATSEGWVAGAASTFTSRDGFFGGNFINNGPSAENKVEFDNGPFGSRECVWMTVPEVGNDNDGGWNKTMDGFDNSTNNGFMSVVYVRRDSGTASGSFFHGCSGTATNNLDGTANTNPYFIAGISVSTLPIDVWCVAIGIIYASSDANTSSSGLGGIYRLDTGARTHTATTFRQKPSQTIQQQRVYHFYSTNTTAQLDFAKPGFYILDGSEPTLSELTAGAGGGDDVFWSASGNDIYNDNTGNVGIGTTNPSAKLEITGSTPTAGDTTLHLKLPLGNVTAGATEMGNILFSSTDTSNGGSGSIAKISTIAGNGSNAWIGQGRPTDLAFFTQPIGDTATLVEAMRINQNGNVGIGATTPLTLLNLEGVKNTSIITLESTTNDANWSVGDKIGAINFYSADDSGAGAGVKASMSYENSSGATGATNALVFNTAGTTTGTNNTERMRIDSAGDTSFTGNVTTGASLISTNAIVDNVVVKTANGNLTFKANGGSTIAQFYNDLNATFIGNVGIGETNPSYKLDVDGSGARIGSSNQTTTALYLTATNTDGAPAIATQIIMQGYEGRAKGTFYTDVSETGEWFNGVPYNASHNYWHVGFDETGGEAEYRANAILTVRDNGNVGIGEGDPTAPLQVVGIAEYTNNTTALAAGLTVGAFYRTGDDLKVVH